MTTDQEQLLRKWQRVVDEAREKVFTWTEPLTSAWLCEQASHSEFGIEVGVYMGYTSFLMLRSNPNLHLWSIDPFQVAGTEHVTRQNLKEFIAQGRCEIIPKFTKDVGDQLDHMRSRMDLAFVDDGHLEAEVSADIDLVLPLMRQGAIISGHDYETSPINDVAVAVQKKLKGHWEPCPRLWAFIKQ